MRTFSVACCIMALTLHSPAYAAERGDACHGFFDSIRTRAVAVLHDRQHSFQERYSRLEALFNEAVDVPWIARFVAGPYWRTASEQEQKEFVEAYRAYLADHYMGGLNEDDFNSMKDIKVFDFTAQENNSYRVHTHIEQNDGEPISVDYLLQEEPAGTCHLRDFTLEGISLLTAQRDQVNSLAAAGGLKAVTQKLAEMKRGEQHSL